MTPIRIACGPTPMARWAGRWKPIRSTSPWTGPFSGARTTESKPKTEVVVSPEDDVEIRRITLINRSLRTRRLHLTSYVELSLAPHNADRQHPAFNKLFIQTEAVPEQQALLAYRRPREGDDPPSTWRTA